MHAGKLMKGLRCAETASQPQKRFIVSQRCDCHSRAGYGSGGCGTALRGAAGGRDSDGRPSRHARHLTGIAPRQTRPPVPSAGVRAPDTCSGAGKMGEVADWLV